MKKSKIFNPLIYLALIGNTSYIIFLLHNGIEEGFKDSIARTIPPIGMVFLLIFNIFLLVAMKKRIPQNI